MNILFRTSLKLSGFFFLMLLHSYAQAQCPIICKDELIVYVPSGGSYELLPEVLADGDLSVICPNGVLSTQASISGNWQPATGNMVFNDAHVGQLFQCRIRDQVTGNSCWGLVEVAGQAPANDTIHFRLSAELWSDARPLNGATLVFQPINPAFPYTPMTFTLDEDENGVDMAIVPADYLPGTTFSYGAIMPDTGFANGVSILDMCKMSRHILGIEPLPSPYSMIAADINKSGSITTFDLVESRKLLLNIYNQFPNNNAWRLFPDYCSFSNPNNPFQGNCISEISLAELVALDNDTARIYAVKIGDVDGDVQIQGTPTPNFGAIDSITMLIPQGTIQANTPVAVPVKLDKDYVYGGLQMLIKLAPSIIQFDSITPGGIPFTSTAGLASYNQAESELRLVMVNQNPTNSITIPANEPLFYIHLKSTQTVQLQDVMQLNTSDPQTPSLLMGNNCSGGFNMGYTYAGFVPVHTPLAKGVLLNPPSPNPFTNHSWMEISLEQQENVLLEIADLTGRILHAETRQLGPGATRWELPVEKIPAGSMCLWRLVIAGKSASGKLVRK